MVGSNSINQLAHAPFIWQHVLWIKMCICWYTHVIILSLRVFLNSKGGSWQLPPSPHYYCDYYQHHHHWHHTATTVKSELHQGFYPIGLSWFLVFYLIGLSWFGFCLAWSELVWFINKILSVFKYSINIYIVLFTELFGVLGRLIPLLS